MKHIFQFLDTRDGSRTPVFGGTTEAFAKVIMDIIEKDENFDPEKMAVIALVDMYEDEKVEFSIRPLLTAANFVKYFGDNQNGTRTVLPTTQCDDGSTALQSGSSGGDSTKPLQQEPQSENNIRCGTIDPGVCG